MKYMGTSFSLTLGAWRLRFSFDLEDAPDDRTVVMQNIHSVHAAERTRERA
jgi:hypothetical protein